METIPTPDPELRTDRDPDPSICTQEFWGAYLAAMDGAGFNQSAPLYVASGLLTYMNATGARPNASSRLRTTSDASRKHHADIARHTISQLSLIPG